MLCGGTGWGIFRLVEERLAALPSTAPTWLLGRASRGLQSASPAEGTDSGTVGEGVKKKSSIS